MQLCLACGTSFAAEGWRCPACGHAPSGVRWPLFAPELAGGGVGFDASSFELLPQVEEGSFWFRARNELIAWLLRSYAPRARSMLEVGCGTGFVLGMLRERFPHLQLAAGDLTDAALDVAARRAPGADLLQIDVRRIPFVSEFDVLGAFDVLEHVDEDDAALAAMFGALRPGGALLVTVPQHPWLWSDVDEFAQHCRRYTRATLVRVLEDAGFALKRVTSFVTLLLPAMAASRVVQRRRDRPVDPLAEYRMPARLDSVLDHVMALERQLIVRGVDLPVGGSLLAVAERPS